jgi:hypothetical protein
VREQHVEHREHLGRVVEAAPLAGHRRPQLVEQVDLAPHALLLGAEHLPLPLVELGGRVAFGVLHRLLADVVRRHLLRMRPADLQEEAEHAVVADLERGDARPLDLLRLVAGDPGLAAGGELHELVEGRVEARPDEAALAGEHRAAFAERGGDAGGDVGAGVEAVAEIAQQAAARTEQRHHVGEDRRRPADPLEVARAGPARHHPADEPLDVADARQPLREPRREDRVGDERGHRIETVVDRRHVDQRRREPVAEEPRPHRRLRAVEHAGQRARAASGGHRAHELQAAAGGLVDLEPSPRPPGGERVDPADRGRLVLLEIRHHRAGGRDAGGIGGQLEPEPLEPPTAERPADRSLGGGGVEPPVGPGREEPAAGGPHELRDGLAVLLRTQALRGIEPQQVVEHVVPLRDRRLEAARGHVDPREPHLPAGVVASGRRQDRDQPVGPRRIEERLVGGDAGGDDPRHLATEQALGRLRVVDLLADRHVPARGHELHQLRVELVMREPRHRQGVGALVAAGEREVEQVGGLAGVVAEELVEVSHPKQHERAGAAGLRRLELLHHGGRRRRHGRKCISL